MISVGRGYFATSSSVGTIKIWEPLRLSPIATITEENGDSIDFMVPVISAKDVKIIYVCKSVLKCFSVKNLRSMTLLTNDRLITAIT